MDDIFGKGALVLKAYKHDWNCGIDFAVAQKLPSGELSVATNITMKVQGKGVQIEPLFNLRDEAAQELMDDLWNAGIRPSISMANAQEATALTKHLEDMRKIAFHKLKIEVM